MENLLVSFTIAQKRKHTKMAFLWRMCALATIHVTFTYVVQLCHTAVLFTDNKLFSFFCCRSFTNNIWTLLLFFVLCFMYCDLTFLFYEQFPSVLHYEMNIHVFLFIYTHTQTHMHANITQYMCMYCICTQLGQQGTYTVHTKLNTHPLVVTFPVDMHQKPQHTREAPISSNVVQYRFEPSNQM